MVFKLVIILSCLYLVSANDIRLGYTQPSARKIYSEILEANPAIWKRTDDIVVNTTGNDVISAVYVTDLRDDKDGEAIIESGGVGEKSVTIGLKSPTIFRGYKFEVQVYAVDPTARYYSKGGSQPYQYEDQQYPRKY